MPGSAAIAISEINFAVVAAVPNAKLEVTSLGTTTPAGILAPGSYKIFQYINIIPTKIVNENLKDVTIKFTVDKSWLTANNVQEANVVLLRYSGGQWTELPTQVLASGSKSVTFSATTPGFSYFAVSGKPTAVTTTPTPTPTPQPGPTPRPEEAPEEQPTPEGEIAETTPPTVPKGKIPLEWLVAIVVLLAVAGAYFYFSSIKDKKTK